MNRSTFFVFMIIFVQFPACGYQYDASGNRKLLPAPVPRELPYEIVGRSYAVWSGNECQLSVGQTSYYLILQGVNHPDSSDLEQQSCDHLQAILSQGPVRAVVNRRDPFQRGIARLYLGDMDINLEMILSGYASYDGTDFEGSSAFAEAEKIARSERRGIWYNSF
jgi:hypothetical protein